MEDDLDSIIDILNDNEKFQPAKQGGMVLERPSKKGLPPLIQRKSSQQRVIYHDGKAQAEADLKLINDKIQMKKDAQIQLMS